MLIYTYKSLLILSIITLTILFCKDPEVEKKIDANLRLKIKTLQESAQLDKKVSVVFKSTEPLTDLHKSVLQKKGIKVIASIGHIHTASLPAKAVYDLAKMKFVDSIQGSREVKIPPVDSIGTLKKF